MGKIGNFIRVHNGANRTFRELKKLERSITAIEKRLDSTNKRIASLEKKANASSKAIAANTAITQTLAFGQYAIDTQAEALNEAKLQWFRSLPPANGDTRKLQEAVFCLLKKLRDICDANDIQYWIDFGTLLGAVRHGGFIPWDDDIDVGMMRNDVLKLIEVTKDDPDFTVGELYFHSPTHSANHNCQFRFKPRPGLAMPYCIDIFIYDYCDDASESGESWQILDELKRAYRKEAWELHDSLGLSFPEDLSDGFQRKVQALFEERFAEAFEKAGLSHEPKSDMIWGFDNALYNHKFSSTGPVSDVFPLVKLEYEGEEFSAPCAYEKRLKGKYGDYLSLPQDLGKHVHFTLGERELRSLDYVLARYVYHADNADELYEKCLSLSNSK